MRVLTCLSQNVSMVYDSAPPRPKRWTDRLGFKQRKRKRAPGKDLPGESAAAAAAAADSRRPFDQPACSKRDGSRLYCSRVDIENKENEDPRGRSSSCAVGEEPGRPGGLGLAAVTGCEKSHRTCSAAASSASYSSSSSSSSSYFFPRRTHHPPLPPIPCEGGALNASIYVKEFSGTQDDALDSDYLPLSEVLSPLREESSIDHVTSPESTDISVGTYEALQPRSQEPNQLHPPLRVSESDTALSKPAPKAVRTAVHGAQTEKRPTAKPSALRRLYSPNKQHTASAQKTSASCKYASRGSKCQSIGSGRGSSTCSVGSSTSSVISTGPGFNRAFLRGAGSVVSQFPNPSPASIVHEPHLLSANRDERDQRVPPIYHPDMLTPPSPYRSPASSGSRDDRNSPCGASPADCRSSPSGACSVRALSPADSSGSLFVSSMSEDSSPSLTSMIAQRGGVKGAGGGAEYSLDADDEEELTQDDMTQVTQETTQGDGTQWYSQETTQCDSQDSFHLDEDSMQYQFKASHGEGEDVADSPEAACKNHRAADSLSAAGYEEPRYVNARGQPVAFYQYHADEADPVLRVLPDGEQAQPYGSARVSVFRKHVVSDPDPYDTVEEEEVEEEMMQNNNNAGDTGSERKGVDAVDVDDVACGDFDDVAGCGTNGYVNGHVVCPSSSASEFLGCMSFGVQHLLKKDLNGWYYLLTEEVGRKKHLQAHSRPKPAPSHNNIPEINTAVEGQERIMISVQRGKNGFGFTFVSELPPRVGRVDRASPAEQAGIKKGDAVIRINGKNVSRSTCEGVARMVKKLSPQTLTLELQRDHVIPAAAAATTTEVTATGTTTGSGLGNKRGVGTSTDHLYESIREGSSSSKPQRSEYSMENQAMVARLQDVEFMTDDDGDDDDEGNLASEQCWIPTIPSITSTPRPVISRGVVERMSAGSPGATSHSMSKQENIHRLMSLELNYLDFMRYGIERYSRPLRHCIVSAHQHRTMFQNVEKMVTISEFHFKQMQENTSSVNSDTDDSQSSEASMFPNSVALIYYSKIHMFCQAYEDYAYGLLRSNAILRELRKNREFMNFIREPGTEDGQSFGHPSISAFINRPVQHIQELHGVLSDIFSSTPLSSPDFHTLQQVVVKLAQCVANIAGLSSAGRVQSMDSLSSSGGGSSTYSHSHSHPSHSHSKGAASGGRAQHSKLYQGAAAVARLGSQSTSSGKGSMASLASSCSSSERDALLTQQQPSQQPSQQAATAVNRDVLRLQESLVFAPHVKVFQLCQEDRHLIFQGDVYRQQKQQQPSGNNNSASTGSVPWCKSLLFLFSDLLLLVNETLAERDGDALRQLYVAEDPIAIQDIVGIEIHRKYASEFILHVCPAGSHMTPTVLRAPSVQEKIVWARLLEQRVLAVKGSSLQHYGSARDISSVKTSVIL